MDRDNTRFSEEHEWVRTDDGADLVTVGITEFAANELGDIVYVELPDVGSDVTAHEPMGTIEAVKTVADLFAPVSGVVETINDELEGNPELVNSSPYEQGWLVKIKVSDAAQLESLMSSDAYQELISKE